MSAFSKLFTIISATSLFFVFSPQISRAQSKQNSGYSPVKPQEFCEDCQEEDEEEIDNTPAARHNQHYTRVDIHNHNYNLNLITHYPDKKSPWLAFGLEFFVGWGTGHFYAGNYGWGIYGLSGLFALIYGAVQLGNNNPEMGIYMMVYGALSRVVNIVSAPIVTMNRNEEKKKKYVIELRKKGIRPHQYYGFHNNSQWEPQTPYTRFENGKSLIIPVFHTTF